MVPLTGLIDPKILIEGGRNTIVYEQDDARPRRVSSSCSQRTTRRSPARTACATCSAACPALRRPGRPRLSSNIFRVLIMQFIDAHSFDVRSVKKTCVHIVHPDGRLIPFDTYNLFYRDDLERTRLEPLRVRSDRIGLTRMP